MEDDELARKLQLLIASRLMNRTSEHGTIYYIGCPDTRRLKIGFTKSNPSGRLAQLQTGSPTELMLLAMHPGSMDDERFIHDFFAYARLHGEWFEMDENLFAHLAFVCWAAAVEARYRRVDVPRWAKIGLESVEGHYGPLPTDLGGRLQ